MKKIIYLILLTGLIFSSCSTSYHLQRAKKKCPECFTLDTTITEVVFKLDTVIKIDTNIIILLPRDTARIDTTIKKLKLYSFEPIYSKNGVINVKISMQKGVLSVASHLDSSFIYRYQDSIRVKDAIISNLKEVVIDQGIIIKEEKKTKERFKTLLVYARYIILGLSLFFIIAIIIKLIKWIKK